MEWSWNSKTWLPQVVQLSLTNDNRSIQINTKITSLGPFQGHLFTAKIPIKVIFMVGFESFNYQVLFKPISFDITSFEPCFGFVLSFLRKFYCSKQRHHVPKMLKYKVTVSFPSFFENVRDQDRNRKLEIFSHFLNIFKFFLRSTVVNLTSSLFISNFEIIQIVEQWWKILSPFLAQEISG